MKDALVTKDTETSVESVKRLVQDFVDEREWQPFHNPKNLVMSLAIETAELMEHFQWLTPEEAVRATNDPTTRHEITEELADCFAYLLSLANAMEVDLSEALKAKMAKNATKYPVESSRGIARPNPNAGAVSEP